MKKNSAKQLTVAGLLIALGIIIPMYMPRYTMGPASFTLASHVPVFLAMFINPFTAVVVALGTAFGFFLTATPIIAFRALSHIVFAVIGAMYLQKNPKIVLNIWHFAIFNVVIAFIHTIVELGVVTVFFSAGNMPEAYYSQGFFYSIVLLMGVGGFIHSLVDYTIAYVVAKSVARTFDLPVFTMAKGELRAEQKLHAAATK